MNFTFCPKCAQRLQTNEEGLQTCPHDGFVNWDNPIPVAATLVPFPEDFVEKAGQEISIHTYATPENSKVLLVQRDRPPFEGSWCLPCGYINRNEHPKAAAARETREESGVIVRIEQIICLCNPAPGEVNQSVIHYLGRPTGGILEAGDDARSYGLFPKDELPNIGFRSHRKVIGEWFSGDLGRITGIDLRR